MTYSTISDAAKTSKKIATNVAKIMAQEPFEMLKSSASQIFPSEISLSDYSMNKQTKLNKPKQNVPSEAEIKTKDVQRVSVLEKEVEEIRKEKIYKETMDKILRGEDVFLNDIPELTLEQKQVLLAQQQVIAQRKNAASRANVSEPIAKRSRRFLGLGQKAQAQRQQTRVESPLPPSG